MNAPEVTCASRKAPKSLVFIVFSLWLATEQSLGPTQHIFFLSVPITPPQNVRPICAVSKKRRETRPLPEGTAPNNPPPAPPARNLPVPAAPGDRKLNNGIALMGRKQAANGHAAVTETGTKKNKRRYSDPQELMISQSLCRCVVSS